MNNKSPFRVRKLKELNHPDFTYFIPSYQRGYRWETKQVTELLEDIFEVIQTDQKKYCLQPIVVKEIKDKNDTWEVIDGQQRLTTILIILQRLKRFSSGLFNLDYETRKNCIEFFDGLNDGKFDNSNPDFAHISNAYQVVDSWIKDKIDKKTDTNIELKVYLAITEVLEVIWFEVDKNEKDSIKIFTRLNTGKIPLTNAELIKAIFLSEDNIKIGKSNTTRESEEIYLKQIEISNDWNLMEYCLQDNMFWSFINRGENDIPTRINFLFELVVQLENVQIKEKYDSFRYFYNIFVIRKQASQDNDFLLKQEWSAIKKCFGVLQEWFLDKHLYHLIGYLIWAGEDIKLLYQDCLSKPKKAFKDTLKTKIGAVISNINIDALDYKNSVDTMKILVLFNVLSVDLTIDKSMRFPFESLKSKNNLWSLEHIHAQNSEDISQRDYKDWLNDHKGILLQLKDELGTKGLIKNIEDLIGKIASKDKSLDIPNLFNEISEAIFDKLSAQDYSVLLEKDELEKYTNTHHISNMALLDTKSNSALSNSVFAVKRDKIITKEKQGAFIPITTKNVFLKYYSIYPEHLIYWSIEDKINYLNEIKKIVNPFF